MKSVLTLTLFISLLFSGCAGLAEKSRIENFSRVADAYEQALRISDYGLAAQFLDPAAPGRKTDPGEYKNIKIVEYKVTHVDVCADNSEIKQDVELQYFLLNNNRLRTAVDRQTWRYRETEKVWLLETGLPALR